MVYKRIFLLWLFCGFNYIVVIYFSMVLEIRVLKNLKVMGLFFCGFYLLLIKLFLFIFD